MEKLDVLYTVDDKYIDIMLASALSLIINGNLNGIRLHIITSNFSLEDYDKVENVLCKYPNVELYFYDIATFDIEKYGIPDWRGTQIANARLFYQDILGASVDEMDNLLYLDSDTIVVSDLNDLEEYNTNTISAVKDGCFKNYLTKLGGLSNYFNSGVLYFNVSNWTQERYQDKIVHFLENCNVPLMYPDQDALNCALDGSIESLPLNYNLGANAYLFGPRLQVHYYGKKSNVSNSEIVEAKKDPKILHSTGILSIKPWSNNKINPFNDEFMKYILMANPEFEKVEISKLKQILSASPIAFRAAVIAKVYMPEPIRDFSRKLSL
ncbi:MAG: glycosyltransferase family 8 protein [Bacilli bacterium]|nr:glycosyltransferase family 8 protein [Bacilli bacterium]